MNVTLRTLRHCMVILALALSAGAAAVNDPPSAANDLPRQFQERPIRAAILVNPPFVMENTPGVYTGFAIELWEKVAALLNLKFAYVPCQTVPELIDKLTSNQVDIAVVNAAVTSSRLKLVDFTHPYLNSGLQIMINEDHRFAFSRFFHSLQKYGFIDIFLYGGLIVLVLTVLLTVALRRLDKDFHKQWHAGLAEAFYHVMSVTMTGKSNYKGAVGPLGRVLAGLWLVCGVAVVAYITSSVTSIMTTNKLLHEIHSVRDLGNKAIGAVRGSAAAEYCAAHQLLVQEYDDLSSAVDDLVSRDIQAIVGNAPELQYFDHQHPDLPITEVGPVFNEEMFAFALPRQSDLRRDINFELLKLRESDFLLQLQQRYFGNP